METVKTYTHLQGSIAPKDVTTTGEGGQDTGLLADFARVIEESTAEEVERRAQAIAENITKKREGA